MRYHLLFAALAAFTLWVGPAAAQTRDQAYLVESYYEKYLHRPADPVGMKTWLDHFSWGESAESIQAQLMSSDEYWQINGANPQGFVAAMYNDVLGRSPNPNEVATWLNYWSQDPNNRLRTTSTFMIAARSELTNQAATRWFAPPTNVTVLPPPLPAPRRPFSWRSFPWRP
jgi:hypothetical protein